MSDDQVDPKKDEASLLPPGWEKKVPARAGEAVKALQELSSKDRRSVLRAFQQRSGGMQVTQQSVMMQASSWVGPLPPPEILARYNQVIPNGAERLVAMAERQSQHRIELESHVAREQVKQSGRGQFYALLIGLSGLGTAAYVARLGLGTAAASIATVALGTLAVTFIVGKRAEGASRAAKVQAFIPPPEGQSAQENVPPERLS